MAQPPQGVKTSAYIFYALAVIAVLVLCGVIGVNGFTLANAGGDDTVVTSALVGMGVGGCVGLLVAALYGFVGYSLMKLQKWARIAAIVLGILSLCNFPIGTILGGIVLYFMFQQDVQQAFATAT